MIEELKQLLTIIGNVPDMAMHAFFAFGAYKLIVYMSTTAGVYGVLRLAINTWKEVKLTPKESTVKMVSSDFSMYNSDFEALSRAISRTRYRKGHGLALPGYVSSDDVSKIIKFIDSMENEKTEAK